MPVKVQIDTNIAKDVLDVKRNLSKARHFLGDVLNWVVEKSAPNASYKYSRCIVCGHAWWDDEEQHNFGCWVPGLKSVCKESAGE